MAENNDILGIVAQFDITDIQSSIEKLVNAFSNLEGVSKETAKEIEKAYKEVMEASEEDLAKKSKEALDAFGRAFEEARDTAQKNATQIEETLRKLNEELSKAQSDKSDIKVSDTEGLDAANRRIEEINAQIISQTTMLDTAKQYVEMLNQAYERLESHRTNEETPSAPPSSGEDVPNEELEQSKEAADLLIQKLQEVAEESAKVNEQLQEFGSVDADTTNIDELKAKLEEYASITQQTSDVAQAAYKQQEDYVEKLRDAHSELNEKIRNFEGTPEELERMNEQYAQLDEELSKGEQNLEVLGNAMRNAAQEAQEASDALQRCNEAIQQMDTQAEQSSQKVDTLWQKLQGWATGHGQLSQGLETFKKGLDKLPIPIKTATDGIGEMVKGLWAMCKTPVGMVLAAITLALQTLFQWFTKNAEGQKQFARVSAYLSSILSSLSDIAVKVGKYLFHAFADAGAPMNAFAKGLVTTFKSAVEAVINLVGGLGKVVKGIFTRDWDTFTAGLSQAWDGIKGAGQTVINAIDTQIKGIYGVVRMASDGIKELASTDLKGALNQMHRTAMESSELAYKQKETEIAISKAKEKEAALDAEIAKSREKIYTLTGKERLEEIQRLKAMQQEKYGERIKQYEEMYKIQKRTNELHSSTLADEEKERQLNIQLLQLKAQQAAATRMTARLEESTKHTILNEGKKNAKQTAVASKANAALAETIYTNEDARIKIEKELESRIADAKVAAMKEGFEKTMAERQRQNEAELDNIEKQRQAELDKEYKRQKDEYNKEQAAIKAQGGKVVDWDKDKFNRESDHVKKINSQFDQMVELTKQKQINADREVIDERIKSMRDYLKEYGTYQQQMLAIAEEYAEKIRRAQEKGDKGEVLRLQAEQRRAEGATKANDLARGIDFSQMFEGVGTIVKSIAEDTYRRVQEYKGTEEYRKSSPESKKAIADLEAPLIEKGGAGSASPFSAATWDNITTAAQAYDEALKQLQIDYDAHTAAVKEQEEAHRDLNNVLKQFNATNIEEALKKIEKMSVPETLKAVYKGMVNNAQKNAQNADEKATETGEKQQQSQTKVQQTGQDVQNAATQAARGLQDFNTILNQIKGGSLGGFADGVSNIIHQIAGKTDKEMSGLIGLIGEKAGGIVGAILSIIDMLGDNPTQVIDSILDGIAKVIQEVIAHIPEIIASVVKGVGNIIGGVFSGIGGMFGFGGADYSDYNEAKERYDTLIKVWDTLIQKKKEYLNERWGIEAQRAGEEALELIKAEREQTRILAETLLGAGASAGSHSINYRMWEGSYSSSGSDNMGYLNNGRRASTAGDITWSDVNKAIERGLRDAGLGNASFNSMSDLLNMTSEQLEWIMKNYTGLWAHMDGDFRDLLQKTMELGEQEAEVAENIRERILGTSKESFIDSLLDPLYDFQSSTSEITKAVSDSFAKMWNNMILNNNVKAKYQKQLEDLYDEWYKLYESGNTIDESEKLRIQNAIKKVEEQMIAERDRLKKEGWLLNDNTASDQSATYNSAEKITYEQADELVSRATARQIILEHQYELMSQGYEVSLSTLQNVEGIRLSVTDMASSIAQTVELQDAANSKLDRIIANTAPISEIRDIVKKLYNER